MPWYKVHVEAVVRGYAYVEAPDSVSAAAGIEAATIEQAMNGQQLRDVIQEKISFTALDTTEMVEGVDFK